MFTEISKLLRKDEPLSLNIRKKGMTNQAGAFLNMDTLKMNPVML
jgi:hypothetical protein